MSITARAGGPPQRPTSRRLAFAEVMSSVAGGVVVVTTWFAGRPWGLTATAFASVSADPPTILVSLATSTETARAIAEDGNFGASVLAHDQRDVAVAGSIRGEPKFLDAFAPEVSGHGNPVVGGSLSHLDCEVVESVVAADHTIFVARVVGTRTSGTGRPLVHFRRAYSTLGGVEAVPVGRRP